MTAIIAIVDDDMVEAIMRAFVQAYVARPAAALPAQAAALMTGG